MNGELCRLRPYRSGDESALCAVANDFEVVRWMTRRFPHPYTLRDAEEWIAIAMADARGQILAIEVDGAIAGGIAVEPLEGERTRHGALRLLARPSVLGARHRHRSGAHALGFRPAKRRLAPPRSYGLRTKRRVGESAGEMRLHARRENAATVPRSQRRRLRRLALRPDAHHVSRAIVTGASGGLGLEFAKLLAADKHDLVLIARSADKLDAIAADLRNRYGVNVETLALDLSQLGAAAAVFARVPECDVLINNAGFATNGRFDEIPEERIREEVLLDVLTLTELTRAYLPAMRARGAGRVLNVASTAGFLPGPFMAVYYACKAYVLSFSQAIAEELRGTGVTVTCLCPGATATGFADRAHTNNDASFQTAARRQCGVGCARRLPWHAARPGSRDSGSV